MLCSKNLEWWVGVVSRKRLGIRHRLEGVDSTLNSGFLSAPLRGENLLRKIVFQSLGRVFEEVRFMQRVTHPSAS